ncbi:hypothetical protein AXK11_03490 [Cephaloticoccus primus]|uniref:AMP-dependent synthetase/ligase domain-containing protein n=1 Tax=Cephaloticoccus primus TaxID=1548207 RepID=A0A139SQQ1_9BACT|nr:AMP-binding protein [Cephaloticoccus primus]KXU36862.1 hypothetical protein AXK11_03490 [Cephaloticoccus primus]
MPHTPLTPLAHLLLPGSTDRLIADQPALTHSQWTQHSLQLAAALRSHGVQQAALWFEDAALFSIALFACWRAGITAVLSPDAQAHTANSLSGQVDLWLSDVELPYVSAAKQWRINSSAQLPDEAPDVASLAACELNPQHEIILCTSGSSGTPKQIRKHWQQLQLEISALQQQWPMHPDIVDCVLGSVSVQHMYGLPFRILWPLSAGVMIDRPQRPYPESLQHASLMHPRIVWVASPALLQRLGDQINWGPLRERIVHIYSAGGPLPLAVSDLLLKHLGQRPVEIYGSSETGVIAFRSGADDWHPFRSVTVSLNAHGALHVQSPWVQTEGEQTSDGAELTTHGFRLRERLDRIVKIEGKRIALPILENALSQHPAVSQVHVGSAPNTTTTQAHRLAALVALSTEGLRLLRNKGRAALVNHLRRSLIGQIEPLAIPRIWRFFEQLPVDTQGKVTKSIFEEAVISRPHRPDFQALTSRTNAKPHTYEYAIKIPYDLVYFGGHFPDMPVVPGVAQIGWAMEIAQQSLLPKICPDFRFGSLEALKFQKIILPSDILTLTLYFDVEEEKLHFIFRNGDTPCSSGWITNR